MENKMDIRCFRVSNDTVCFDYFYQRLITKEGATFIYNEERDILVKELEQTAEENTVKLLEHHRFEPRNHYYIYKIGKRLYLLKFYDGITSIVEYFMCGTRRRCINIMLEREKYNTPMY
jgi:hypothetical protein